ncbi:MAG: VCBS repeat-containing protein, partial [Methylophilaceae bacterium]|nr:VCBS repeat-containing protein [Methylophilaceae bacterium]
MSRTALYDHYDSDTHIVWFRYWLQRGDSGSISVASNALFLPSLGIVDEAGNKLSASVPSLAANNALTCSSFASDTSPPTISSMAWRNDLATRLVAGNVVTVAVLMSESVNVSGTPTLAMDVGASRVQASYASGSGSNVLIFTYVVQASQSDSDGISVPVNGFNLNGGAIRDAGNNIADLTYTENLTQWTLRQGPLVGSVTAAAPILYLQEDNGLSGSDRVVSPSKWNSFIITTTQTNVDYYEYRIDGGSWVVWNNNPLMLGAHDYEARMRFLDGSYSAISAPVRFTLTDGTLAPPHVRLKTLREGVDGFQLSAGGMLKNAGDVNGDGLDDVLLRQNNKVYVVFGQTQGHNLDVKALEAGVGGFVIQPSAAQTQLGLFIQSLTALGDVNGDGLADIALSVYRNGQELRERAYIIYGKNDGNPIQLEQVVSKGQGSLIQSNGAYSDTQLSIAGDVNADGLSDLAIVDNGQLFVVFGSTGSSVVGLNWVGAGVGGYKIYSTAQFTSITSATVVGDFNGDGHDDLALTLSTWTNGVGSYKT